MDYTGLTECRMMWVGVALLRLAENHSARTSRSACPGPSGLSVCAPPSFIERYLLQETAMKARLVTNAIQSGHAARDYMRLVYGSPNSSSVDTGSKGQAAHELLRVFEEHNRPSPIEPVIPVRSLVSVLTHDMRGLGDFSPGEHGKTEGARLYVGCPVRVVGIPERKFFIREIFWDYEEARIHEIGTHIEYVFPWDCLEFPQE